jgi:hypothetical protein
MSRALGHSGRRRSAWFSATFLIDAKSWPDLPLSYPPVDLAVPILRLSLFELNMSTTPRLVSCGSSSVAIPSHYFWY